MSSNGKRRGPYRSAVAASAVLLLATTVGVHAQERGFFEMLFGTPRQAAPAPAPAPAPTYGGQAGYAYGSQGGYGYADRSSYRHRAERRRAERRAERRHTEHRRGEERRAEERRSVRVKTRYAALPRVEMNEDGISPKQPVNQKAILDNPAKAILEDRTLRAGDIVVMPNGPKVFTGSSTKTHRAGDFEDVKRSRLVSKKTRRQLLAMMVPIGAMPADQARKVMKVKLKLAHEDEIRALEAKNEAGSGEGDPAAVRKIMPWQPTTH